MREKKENIIVVVLGLILGALILVTCGSLDKAQSDIHDEFDSEVNDHMKYYLPSAPYLEEGYSSLKEYWDDVQAKREEAKGLADEAIETYSSVITETEETQLREHERVMLNAIYISDYEDALEAFGDILVDCENRMPKKVYRSSYSGGVYSDPLNFKFHGVLYDDKYRYTYYSSNVLYHYRTPEWTLGSDGIYRDSKGRVVVASDDYAEGTVVHSDIFGECIVLDCGVGTSGTLDVYTAF